MEPATIYKLFTETESLIANFEKRTRKGKSLDEGNDVCRYLFWSGLLALLKANASQSVVTVNAGKLEKRVSALQEAIRERFKRGE